MKVLNLYDNHTVYYHKKGYACIWKNGKNKLVHVLEWEKYYGKKPEGYQLHHKDEDKKNWVITNLELLTQSDHFKIHAGWIRENDIWVKKPCKDCKQLLPLDKFYQRKGLTPSNRCIECSSIFYKTLRTPEFIGLKKVYLKNYYKLNKEKSEQVKSA